MKDLDVNLAIWRKFMNTTLRAVVHLGKDYDANLRCVKNLLRRREKLVSGQTETAGISLINFQDMRWMSTSLLHSRAHHHSIAKGYGFSDSVLCLGKMGESWKSKIQWYSDNNYFKDVNRIDGQTMEFEWKIFPGLTAMGILNQIQQMMRELQCEPENFTGRIISKTIKQHARRFPRGHRSLLGLGSEKKWYRTYDHKPDGSWDRTAEKMLQNFAETNHPLFRGTSALERGEWRRKWQELNTLQWQSPKRSVASPNGHLRQSAQYLRSSSGYYWKVTSWSESCGEIQSTRSIG